MGKMPGKRLRRAVGGGLTEINTRRGIWRAKIANTTYDTTNQRDRGDEEDQDSDSEDPPPMTNEHLRYGGEDDKEERRC